MNFNPHWELYDRHAIFSASKYHWINYDDDKLLAAYHNSKMAERGVRIHDLAKEHILLGIKMPTTKTALNMYVNDAIGYKMTPEQPLYYSEFFFGTCDAISFRKNKLRIHDLKTSVTKGHLNQLLVYTSLFCLEYDIKPSDIEIELRIYQQDELGALEILGHLPEVD